jgi:hypothetical protein
MFLNALLWLLKKNNMMTYIGLAFFVLFFFFLQVGVCIQELDAQPGAGKGLPSRYGGCQWR